MSISRCFGEQILFWRENVLSRYNTGAIDDPKLIPGYSRQRAILKIEGVRLPEEGRDKNQWRFWCDATTSRTHVHYGHITANVLSANRAPINPKLSADFSRGDSNFCGGTILGQFTATRCAKTRYLLTEE